MSYAAFARHYDQLMKTVDYPARADYLCRVLARLGHVPKLCLDLACGTGSLTLELKRRGLDIYGIDGSPDMLSQAQQKAGEAGESILYLCQQMQAIDLYGTVDTVFCTLDSLNHLPGKRELLKTFQRVSLFLEPGGYFLFDMNTPYKHQTVLSDHTFVYDTESVYCVWQNHYEEKGNRVSIGLDFFERDGERYRRSREQFYEYAYGTEELAAMLRESGLAVRAVFEDGTFSEPSEKAERIVCAVQKLP